MKKIALIMLAVSLAVAIPLAVCAEELGTTSIAAGGTADLVLITPSATNGGVFKVPAGKVFIITDVIIFPQKPGSGTDRIYIIQNNANREFWVFPNDRPFKVDFTTGLTIASGYSLKVKNDGTSASPIRVLISGFLK